MNTIHISIRAYNAEKTLRRAIDSVLAQTYKNYKIYVCDNGSTDGTRAIVEEYAKKHGIIPFYNKENHVWTEETKGYLEICRKIPKDDFWAMLDADDELFPEFFETLINFANENDLDIAVGNCESISTITGESAPRMPITGKDLIFAEKEDYGENFFRNFPYFMPAWGRIFRGTVSSVLRDYSEVSLYGADSLANIAVILESKRVGCINKPLMRYYVSPGSTSYEYKSNRKLYPAMLFNALCDVAADKTGGITPNQIFAACNYYANEAKETLRVHLWAKIKNEEKFEDIEYFFSHEITRNLYNKYNYFDIVAQEKKQFDLLETPLAWIYKNINTLSRDRVERIYNLFFDVVYQNKPAKFTEAEIRWMLSVDVALANLLLLGLFDEADGIFVQIQSSTRKREIAEKIKKLKNK